MIDWKEAARHYRTLYSEAVERGCRDRDFWRGRTFAVEREGAAHRREMQAALAQVADERDEAMGEGERLEGALQDLTADVAPKLYRHEISGRWILSVSDEVWSEIRHLSVPGAARRDDQKSG